MPEELTPGSSASPSDVGGSLPSTAKKSDENLMAAISYLWVLSIIILLTKKDSDYVKFHARQGVVLFVISVGLYLTGLVVFFLWPIIWLLDLIILVAVIVGFIKAYGGERYKIPVVGDIAENINL